MLINDLAVFMVHMVSVHHLVHISVEPFPATVAVKLLTIRSMIALDRYNRCLSLSLVYLLSVADIRYCRLGPLVGLVFKEEGCAT